jgi:hypothetical protein
VSLAVNRPSSERFAADRTGLPRPVEPQGSPRARPLGLRSGSGHPRKRTVCLPSRASPARSGEAYPPSYLGRRPVSFLSSWRGLLRDAKRHGSSFSIASPRQQRAIGADLFKQPGADEFIHGLSNRFARNVCRQPFDGPLRARGRPNRGSRAWPLLTGANLPMPVLAPQS